ncbi:hypothetical protein T03_10017 [Trichinella britovi]|uniref:Uncharacterized protein n=1 Tax=Trichinella britovi TaxID=45882 RepID=A0A0V1CN74_TRIBR|nr:hypothetical protein T03_10017 [Trichinella britovi]
MHCFINALEIVLVVNCSEMVSETLEKSKQETVDLKECVCGNDKMMKLNFKNVKSNTLPKLTSQKSNKLTSLRYVL